MKFKQKLIHTNYNEEGTPVFTLNELAEASIDYVITRKTGERPALHHYKETMRQKLVDALPANIHRHDNNRVVRGETRYTVKDWLDAHNDWKEGSRAFYRANLRGLEESFRSLNLNLSEQMFNHYPSDNTHKSAALGQTYGPNERDGQQMMALPIEDLPFVEEIDANPKHGSISSGNLEYIDYHKTDQIRVLCNATLKIIGRGKSDSELDDTLASRCFEELMLGLAMIGSVK